MLKSFLAPPSATPPVLVPFVPLVCEAAVLFGVAAFVGVTVAAVGSVDAVEAVDTVEVYKHL